MSGKVKLDALYVRIDYFSTTSSKRLLETLIGAAVVMDASIFNYSHIKTPNENFAAVILGESHLIIHDLKNGTALLDMLTCGGKDMKAGFDYIQRIFGFTDYVEISTNYKS